MLFRDCRMVAFALFSTIAVAQGRPGPSEPGMARLYVFRVGSAGSALVAEVQINGKHRLSLRTDQIVSVDLAPGYYDISEGEPNQEILPLILSANQIRFVRLDVESHILSNRVWTPLLVTEPPLGLKGDTKP